MDFAQYEDSSRVGYDEDEAYNEDSNRFENEDINDLRKYNPDQPIDEFDEPIAVQKVIKKQ